MLKILLFIVAVSLSVSGFAKQEDKGKGPGGVRSEHASEMGIEKGTAWAGSKEKDKAGKKEEKEKKDKKDKKEKKEKKSK